MGVFWERCVPTAGQPGPGAIVLFILLSSLGGVLGISAESPTFSDITEIAGVGLNSTTFGAVFSDVDNDGDDDLVVSRHGSGIELFLNQGGFSFDRESHLLARTTGDRHGITAIDIDNDGDRDLVIAGGGADGLGEGTVNFVLKNMLVETGDLRFADATGTSGLAENSRYRARALLPVVNLDGSAVDLALVGKARDGFPNEHFVNLGGGALTFAADPESGIRRQASCEGMGIVVDVERDRDQDLLLVCGGSVSSYRRDQSGFEDADFGLGLLSRVTSLAAGDLNNDGLQDLFVGTSASFSNSDQYCMNSSRLHFRMRAQDPVDRLSFNNDGGDLEVDLSYKPGLVVHDPTKVYLGESMTHPESVHFVVSKGTAGGKPAKFLQPGTYIWYDSWQGVWHFLWVHDAELFPSGFRGWVEAEELWGLEVDDIEKNLPGSLGEDRIMVNTGRGFDPWPDFSPLVHEGATGASVMVDIDNDGQLDVVGLRRGEDGGCNGSPFVLMNRGSLGFEEFNGNDLDNTDDDIFCADQLIAGFIDEDGLPDLFMTNGSGLAPASLGPTKLFWNTSVNENHWLIVELRGRQSNRDAFAAQVEVRTPDGALLGYRELGVAYNRSQSSHQLHFGLGNWEDQSEIEIEWPSGLVSKHSSGVDRRLVITEPASPRRGSGRAGWERCPGKVPGTAN